MTTNKVNAPPAMNWLTIKNVTEDENKNRRAELWIDGVIGYKDWMDDTGTIAAEFIRMVNALGDLDTIDVFINTPGGVVSDGVTITNFLINHKASISMTVMGQAASIGSVIVQAADPGKLHMALGSMMFVHDPLTAVIGDADDLRVVADWLDKTRDSIVAIYKRRTNLTDEDIKQLMKDDTLMTAEDAVEWGFADSMDAEIKAVACSDLSQVISDARHAFEEIHKPSGAAGHNNGGQNMPKPNEPAANTPVINRAFLDENHADVVAAIRQEGIDEGSQNGIDAERRRVQAILATPLAAQYNEIVTAAIEKGDAPEQVALSILDAEAKGRTETFKSQRADAPDPLDEDARGDDGSKPAANAPVEDQAKAEWEKNADLQTEFGTFDRFLAFKKIEAKNKGK